MDLTCPLEQQLCISTVDTCRGIYRMCASLRRNFGVSREVLLEVVQEEPRRVVGVSGAHRGYSAGKRGI